MTDVRVVALILAAGLGSRCLLGELPKQYHEILGDKSILQMSIEAFARLEHVDFVRVVISESHLEFYQDMLSELKEAKVARKLLPCCYGGMKRFHSAHLGLRSIAGLSPRHVLIHDACRPFVSSDLILRVLGALSNEIAVIPVVPVHDTIKVCDELGYVEATLDRNKLFHVQTPQGFGYADIIRFYEEIDFDEIDNLLFDDSYIIEFSGMNVKVVDGDIENCKVTTTVDLVNWKSKELVFDAV